MSNSISIRSMWDQVECHDLRNNIENPLSAQNLINIKNQVTSNPPSEVDTMSSWSLLLDSIVVLHEKISILWYLKCSVIESSSLSSHRRLTLIFNLPSSRVMEYEFINSHDKYSLWTVFNSHCRKVNVNGTQNSRIKWFPFQSERNLDWKKIFCEE